MSAIELLPCPFCGGEAKTHGPYGWSRLWCISHNCTAFYNSASEAFKDFPSEAVAITAWNRRTDLSQAAVAAALEAAKAAIADICPHADIPGGNTVPNTFDEGTSAAFEVVNDLITPSQHDALAAHVAAEVAKARAEDAALLAEALDRLEYADVFIRRERGGGGLRNPARTATIERIKAQIGAKP